MKTIAISDLATMENPADGWYHLEANNDHPKKRADGSVLVQVLDNAAMEAICEAGLPDEGLPIDCEHKGMPGVAEVPDTAAMGWVKELAVFDDGSGNLQLAGFIEWTPPGLALVQGKVYKHFSTVYDAANPECAEQLDADRIRPLALLGLALTNNPNNWQGQRPITNTADPLPPPTEAEQTTPKNTNMEYPEKLLRALGIESDAPTEEEVVAAAEALAQRVTAAEEAEAAAAKQEAETLLNAEGLEDLPEDKKEELKDGLINNRALALMTIEALKARKSGAAAPRYAKGGETPRTVVGKPGKGRLVRTEADATLICNRASEIQKKYRAATGRTMSFWKAKNEAKAELKREGKLN